MDRRDGQSIETAQMLSESLPGKYAEDMKPENADMESPIVCDNHSNDNYDLSYGKSCLFAPLPAHSTRGAGRLWRSSESGQIGRTPVEGHSRI